MRGEHIDEGAEVKLRDDYLELHSRDVFGGMTLAKFADQIVPLIRFHNARSILDYGSGKGQAWEENAALKALKAERHVILYDPGVEALSARPTGIFAAVLCIDVVEHIPEDEIAETLSDVFRYATAVVIATFCPRGSKKKLPSTGQDVHITQKPREWWERKFSEANATRSHPVPFYLFENP